MKAIAVRPGRANSAHLADIPMPDIEEVPDGHGVLVRLLCVGVDATDKEINEAKYGKSRPATITWCSATNPSASSRLSAQRCAASGLEIM